MLGYGNTGYGGNMSRGGGMEMYMIIICCCCCLCALLLIGGWWGNLFCGISTSLGKSCTPKETDPPYNPSDDETSGPVKPAIETCNSVYGGVTRKGSDPRPPIRPDYCQGQTATGRDCYLWTVDADPVTQMARWVRAPDPSNPDKTDHYDGSCKSPPVKCPALIKASDLPGYSDQNPNSLIAKCSAAQVTATNRDATLRLVSSAAKSVNAGSWTTLNSRQWYDRVVRLVGQRDLAPLLANVKVAAERVKKTLNRSVISKTVFATMMEAALRGKSNQSDWIVSVTILWANRGPKSESGYIAHLNRAVGYNKLQNWSTVIDNVAFTS